MLELGICIEDRGLDLESLFNNRLSEEQKHSIRVSAIDPRHIYVNCQEEEGLQKTAEILTDIIIENLQVRYIVKELRQNYFFIPENEQCEILIDTLKQIWFAKEESPFYHMRENIQSRLIEYMEQEADGLLTLEGFIRFRMKDYLAGWIESLEDCLDDYILEKEKEEFIKLLRYFVSMKDPGIDQVFLRRDHIGVLRLYNCSGLELCLDISKEEMRASHISQNDLVLSQLVNIAPERIYIQQPQEVDPKLLELIHKVFIGRVYDVD